MRHKLLFFILLFIVLGISSSKSMPAYPRKIPVYIGNEMTFIRLMGDEYNKRAETLEGYTLLQKDNEWYYAEKASDGYLIASEYKLSLSLDVETEIYLKRTPLHLRADKNVHHIVKAKQNNVRQMKTQAAIGNRKILVIMMQFTDYSFVKEQTDFARLFNEDNYREDGACGSVFDFYKDVSYGKLQLVCDVIGPFTSRYDRAYYGGNLKNGDDKNPEALFIEAIEEASLHVNLKNYDADNDGYVDNVHIIFAGHGEEAGASSDAIWSHEATYYTPYEYQNMLIDRYSCAPELRGNTGNGISRIGPHCHEIGHALGAMDFYDTDYDDHGGFVGTGNWDVMAGGSWNADGVIPADFNPYVKMANFGWIDIKEMPEGQILLSPSLDSEFNYYRLSNNENDYYLVENRSSRKWGEALPGVGMLIYHIHPNIANVGNRINASYPQMCYPVCASSNYSLPNTTSASYGSINSSGCPFPGSSGMKQFNMSTKPAAFTWDDETSNIDLRDIAFASNVDITIVNHSNTVDYTESDILSQIDFEQPAKYTILSEQGDSQWKWVKIDDSQKEKNSIKPHGGNGYLCLQPGKLSNGKQQSSVIFSTPETSNKNLASLSFYYQANSYRTGVPVMDISYSCNEKEWESVPILGNGDNSWKYFSINLPEAKSYNIKFTGYASYGQAICLDDLIVTQKVTTGISSINESAAKSSQEKQIYDIFGRKLDSLQKGLNIVRQEDGMVKKILVK